MRWFVLFVFAVQVVKAAAQLLAIGKGLYPITKTKTLAEACVCVAEAVGWATLCAWLLWG